MQNYEKKSQAIRDAFLQRKRACPEQFQNRLKLSWSNWGFGLESLAQSAERLAKNGISYIELHGNHYGPDLGYRPEETRRVLDQFGLKVSGVCGMFSCRNELASNMPEVRQAAVDYIRRELSFCQAMGGHYLLVVPCAVGRPAAYDQTELIRSAQTLRIVADQFVQCGVKAAVEPIRAAEVSFVHTFAEAQAYIGMVNHPGIQHINGDVYHMLFSETHIGEAIVNAGDRLVNLHMADSNRCALGDGMLDLDTIIMALYLIRYNNRDAFVTPEPLGPGGDPYPAMNGAPDPLALDKLVQDTVQYFRAREEAVLAMD